METFWLALGITFWAEMGDKTQFVALAYAARYPARHVLAGMAWGILVMLLASVWLGKLLGSVIPEVCLLAVSAVCFLGFAVWTAFEKPEDEKKGIQVKTSVHPILFIGVYFILAELGDKTIFTTLTLGATHAWLPVWTGGAVGMFAADALGVVVGRWIGQRVPQTFFKWASVVVFTLFGLWTAWQAYVGIHSGA